MSRILLGTKLFRTNVEIRYRLNSDGEWMVVETELTYEVVNPTQETIDFEQTIQFEICEQPKLECISLISGEGSYRETPPLVPKSDDPDVLEVKRTVKISPASKGIKYRFGAKYTVKYALQSFFAQHFGFPTIGATAIIEGGSDAYTVTASPTPLHQGNVWRYDRLFMPGDHFNVRWHPSEARSKGSSD